MPTKIEKAKLENRLDELETERREVKGQLDRDRLMKVTSEVVETITSPEFIERMRKARDQADKGDGMDAVSKVLSIEGLREAGASIPEDFRLTSRVFEDKLRNERFEIGPIDVGRIPDADPLGWGACAGGGGLTFCGCGGFST